VALTDAPACGFDAVNVTVDRVRIHQSSTANDNDSGWTDIAVNPARKIDLLSLQNGVLVDLGQTTLTAGNYTQIRLVLVSNSRTAMANSVTPTNGAETEMQTPSATQSGLKLINAFTIEPNKTTALVLDFDACKSIVRRGNGTFGLKPVIHVIPMSLTAIVGYVQTGLSGLTVTAQKNGVILKATQADSMGKFVLAPLDPSKSPYDVVFSGPTLTTSVLASVPVVAEQTTTLNTSVEPVSIPASMYGMVNGNVGPAGARDTAAVRALQMVGSGPTVEVAHDNVDASNGNYSLQLPTEAARLLNFTNPLVTPLNFVAQGGAGKYKLEASATAYLTQLSGEITVNTGIVVGPNFTLQLAP